MITRTFATRERGWSAATTTVMRGPTRWIAIRRPRPPMLPQTATRRITIAALGLALVALSVPLFSGDDTYTGRGATYTPDGSVRLQTPPEPSSPPFLIRARAGSPRAIPSGPRPLPAAPAAPPAPPAPERVIVPPKGSTDETKGGSLLAVELLSKVASHGDGPSWDPSPNATPLLGVLRSYGERRARIRNSEATP